MKVELNKDLNHTNNIVEELSSQLKGFTEQHGSLSMFVNSIKDDITESEKLIIKQKEGILGRIIETEK